MSGSGPDESGEDDLYAALAEYDDFDPNDGDSDGSEVEAEAANEDELEVDSGDDVAEDESPPADADLPGLETVFDTNGPPVDAFARDAIAPRDLLVVPPDERTTSAFMTSAEYARLVGIRAQQIADGSPRYAAAADEAGADTAFDLAVIELKTRRSPLIVQRVVGTTPAGERIVEEWSARELGLPLNLPAGSGL